MRRTLAYLLVAASFPSLAAELPSDKLALSRLKGVEPVVLSVGDVDKLVETHASETARGGPVYYGATIKQPHAFAGRAKSSKIAWTDAPDGRRVARIAFEAKGALSLDFMFSKMWLPQGAELYVASGDGSEVLGPYTDADNTRWGGFRTPLVHGDSAVIEVSVPAGLEDALVLDLESVMWGYRDIYTLDSPYDKSGSCNVDVACSAADPYRQQVNAVASYTFTTTSGGALCSGQLLNNTNNDRRRLFSTANHCFDTQSEANSLVLYWKYENPTCRAPRSTASGQSIPRSGNSIQQTGGATLLMTYEPPDTTLVELNTAVPASANPFWDGWDRRDNVPTSTSVIHHPSGHEKRIALDFNPAQISNNTTANVPGSQHWRVVDYDVGTTEGGSSGSGLLNPDKRVIGFLSGGGAACFTGGSGNDNDNDGDNGLDDYFGRLSVAWDGGGTPGTRLRDHLDPTSSAANAVDGTGQCTTPITVTLTGPATGVAGQEASFTATATGTGPFTYAWDLDNDGVVDRTVTSSSTSNTVAPVFPTRTSTNVRVTVTGGQCSAQASRAIDIQAPRLDVAQSGTPTQVCGDNDSVIEPGERWSQQVSLTNTGERALAGGYAVFARSGSGASGEYTQATSAANPGTCAYSFVDTSQAPALTLTPSYSNVGASDDGITSPIPVGNFALFGEAVGSVVMSTNGYLATNLEDFGGDVDVTCPNDVPDDPGERLHVLHTDLALQPGGALRSQRFSSCPRPSALQPGTACTVFTWSNAGLFESIGGAPTGNAEFQAILYDDTNEIVYQYRTADPEQGGDATIGIQNTDLSVQSRYACQTPNSAPSNRAVCFFAPGQAPGASSAAAVRVLTPAVALPNLAAGASTQVSAVFQVPSNAACGAPLGLQYVGAVDNASYSFDTTAVVTSTVGASGNCSVFTGSCPAAPAELAKRDGLYANSVRFGNGIAAFNIPTGSTTTFGGQWYTGNADRSPTWLILQGDIVDNQADVPIYRFRQTGSAPFRTTSTIVGRAQISYTSPTEFVATWTLDGRNGGEKMSLLYGTNRPTPNRTGSWYNPAEAGWGFAVDDHILNGQPDEVIVNYIYDAAGNPIWTLGGGSPPGSGTQTHNLFRVHCPSCPSLPDFLNDLRPAGSVSYNYTSLTSGTYTSNIAFPTPFSGTWVRNNLPVQMISQPAPQ